MKWRDSWNDNISHACYLRLMHSTIIFPRRVFINAESHLRLGRDWTKFIFTQALALDISSICYVTLKSFSASPFVDLLSWFPSPERVWKFLKDARKASTCCLLCLYFLCGNTSLFGGKGFKFPISQLFTSEVPILHVVVWPQHLWKRRSNSMGSRARWKHKAMPHDPYTSSKWRLWCRCGDTIRQTETRSLYCKQRKINQPFQLSSHQSFERRRAHRNRNWWCRVYVHFASFCG